MQQCRWSTIWSWTVSPISLPTSVPRAAHASSIVGTPVPRVAVSPKVLTEWLAHDRSDNCANPEPSQSRHELRAGVFPARSKVPMTRARRDRRNFQPRPRHAGQTGRSARLLALMAPKMAANGRQTHTPALSRSGI